MQSFWGRESCCGCESSFCSIYWIVAVDPRPPSKDTLLFSLTRGRYTVNIVSVHASKFCAPAPKSESLESISTYMQKRLSSWCIDVPCMPSVDAQLPWGVPKIGYHAHLCVYGIDKIAWIFDQRLLQTFPRLPASRAYPDWPHYCALSRFAISICLPIPKEWIATQHCDPPGGEHNYFALLMIMASLHPRPSSIALDPPPPTPPSPTSLF